MIMLVNLSDSVVSLGELSKQCKELGNEVGVNILLQHEGIFNAMHKV